MEESPGETVVEENFLKILYLYYISKMGHLRNQETIANINNLHASMAKKFYLTSCGEVLLHSVFTNIISQFLLSESEYFSISCAKVHPQHR